MAMVDDGMAWKQGDLEWTSSYLPQCH